MEERKMAVATNAQGAWDGIERGRVEKVIETLASLRSRGESIAEVAHDARNMVTALTIYCDLLEVPGVLGNGFAHYAQELRLVAAASRRLVEKLLTLDTGVAPDVRFSPNLAGAGTQPMPEGTDRPNAGATAVTAATPGFVSWTTAASDCGAVGSAGAAAFANLAIEDRACDPRTHDYVARRVEGRFGERLESTVKDCSGNCIGDRVRRGDLLPALPVTNLAAELAANRNLLAALAGPSVALTMDAKGGAQAVQLTSEDLTRLLVNLVKNAAEAMPNGGRIHLGLSEIEDAKGAAPCLGLTVEDNGPGVPDGSLERIFASGYTSKTKTPKNGAWPQTHRGLGLAIVRSIVESAGGRIQASNRPQGGACFMLELPVRKTGKSELGTKRLERQPIANGRLLTPANGTEM